MKKVHLRGDAELITHVLWLLNGHRGFVVNALFPNAANAYKNEWLDRDAVAFWHHLDDQKQAQLIDLARDYYRKPEVES